MPENAPLVTDETRPYGSGTLRRLPVRVSEPPFDDDAVTSPGNAPAGDPSSELVQGTLALAFALPTGVPAVPGIPSLPADGGLRRLTLVPPAGDPAVTRSTQRSRQKRAAHAGDIEDFGPQRTPRSLLSEPRPWAGRLVQAIVEVTAGARPVGQLVRWTTTEVYESVCRRTAHLAAVGRAPRQPGAIVRSVHVDEPGDGVAEVCAVVQHGGRCRAVALRLEGVDGRWQCTALQLG